MSWHYKNNDSIISFLQYHHKTFIVRNLWNVINELSLKSFSIRSWIFIIIQCKILTNVNISIVMWSFFINKLCALICNYYFYISIFSVMHYRILSATRTNWSNGSCWWWSSRSIILRWHSFDLRNKVAFFLRSNC